jgi:HPt (histidine-containing phosphotransfer) domain-containing protein
MLLSAGMGSEMATAMEHSITAAFAAPIVDMRPPSGLRPIDLVHLARQTCGDRTLEIEVLNLFRQQLGLSVDHLKQAQGSARMAVAHLIKGSARSVGAFPLAHIAEDIENDPKSTTLVKALDAEVVRTAHAAFASCGPTLRATNPRGDRPLEL